MLKDRLDTDILKQKAGRTDRFLPQPLPAGRQRSRVNFRMAKNMSRDSDCSEKFGPDTCYVWLEKVKLPIC